MLKSSKYHDNIVPRRNDNPLLMSADKQENSNIRAAPAKHVESPAGRENYIETGSLRSRDVIASPSRTCLQDIPINQYDSVSVHSRFD